MSASHVALSKSLSYLLRHGAYKAGLEPIDGYVQITKMLSLPQFKSYNMSDIMDVVKNNDKQRFSCKTDLNGVLWICANQGHSISVPGLALTAILDFTLYPTVIHGTRLTTLPKILQNGLHKMSRNHIHMAKGLWGDVLSGFRKSCDVLIYINLESAMNDGLQFFESKNGVILSPGDSQGYIGTKYFKKVTQLDKNRQEVA